MSPSQTLPNPELMINASVKGESSLRTRYLTAQTLDALKGQRVEAQDVLRKSALMLELLAVSSCLIEALKPFNTASLEETGKPASYFIDRVRETSGLELNTVVGEIAKELQPVESTEVSSGAPTVQDVVKFVRSVLEMCPVSELEKVGTRLAMESWGHRCRRAYDALRAFVLRNDETEQSKLQVVAREYSKASLSLAEVGVLLGASAPDAIALLETRGYRRPLDSIRLAESVRETLLTRIREDRIHRMGQPAYSPEDVRRDVLASERIEGVDAREWIP